MSDAMIAGANPRAEWSSHGYEPRFLPRMLWSLMHDDRIIAVATLRYHRGYSLGKSPMMHDDAMQGTPSVKIKPPA